MVEGAVLASGKKKPEMLQNTLQCTREQHPAGNHLAQNVRNTEAEKVYLGFGDPTVSKKQREAPASSQPVV